MITTGGWFDEDQQQIYDSRTYVILDARPKRPFDIRANRRQRQYQSGHHPPNQQIAEKAGLIEVKRGTGGAHLLRDAGAISLYDVYKAVEVVGEGELFHTHENPNPDCWVGANIHQVLELVLLKAQTAMENILKEMSIKELTDLIIQKECFSVRHDFFNSL